MASNPSLEMLRGAYARWGSTKGGNVDEIIAKVDIHSFRDGKVVRFQEVYDTLGFARALGAV